MTETDYAVPPGEYIAEWLEDQDVSQAELARRLGYSPKHVSLLIRGAPLSAEAAARMELVTKVPAWRWLQLETLYRQDLNRLALDIDAPQVKDLLRSLPVPELCRRGFIQSNRRKPGHCLFDLLAFFRVGSVDALIDKIQEAPLAAFRRELGGKRGAVLSWLQIGEMEAEALNVAPEFRAANLEHLVDELRQLTTSPPSMFGSELVARLGGVGVRLIYVQDFAGTKTYGASRWYRGQPLIQLSLRRRTDDTFWFTLFHEVGHVIRHLPRHKSQTFVALDSSEEVSRWEPEADRFAAEVLIPPSQQERLQSLVLLDDARAFARDIGVAPGVVVGRLQHEGIWGWDKGNSLKMSLRIADDG